MSLLSAEVQCNFTSIGKFEAVFTVILFPFSLSCLFESIVTCLSNLPPSIISVIQIAKDLPISSNDFELLEPAGASLPHVSQALLKSKAWCAHQRHSVHSFFGIQRKFSFIFEFTLETQA